MNIPKVRQRYINLHGDTRHFDVMIKERNENLIKKMMEKANISREEAQKQIDIFDSLDEELDIDS